MLGDMHNRQAITLSMLWHCLKDYELWPIYVVGLTWLTPTKPLEQYLTLQLKAVGFGTFQTNLLTIPAYAMFILNLLFWTWLSERLNSRLLVCLAAPVWNFPLLVALEVLPASASKWTSWALSMLVVGSPYVHAILVAVVSRNAGAVRTRTVATALYNMCVQLSSVIGTQVYRTEDQPLYRTGNKVLIALTVWSFAGFLFAKLYYARQNRRRQKIWDAMTTDEKHEVRRLPVSGWRMFANCVRSTWPQRRMRVIRGWISDMRIERPFKWLDTLSWTYILSRTQLSL